MMNTALLYLWERSVYPPASIAQKLCKINKVVAAGVILTNLFAKCGSKRRRQRPGALHTAQAAVAACAPYWPETMAEIYRQWNALFMNKPDQSHNHYRVDNTRPHIILAGAHDRKMLMRLVIACPAGLFQLQPDGSLFFDVRGCLECGTCRLLCGEETIARWCDPNAGYGIEFRFS
jgi:ferredoxin-like protein FixX